MNYSLMNPPFITNDGVFVSHPDEVGVVNNCMWNEDYNNYPFITVSNTSGKSAREKVQDEILLKMVTAIEADDFKKAKQLVGLAKALKDL